MKATITLTDVDTDASEVSEIGVSIVFNDESDPKGMDESSPAHGLAIDILSYVSTRIGRLQ